MTDEIGRHQRAQLFAVAYRMLGSSHDAEEAVHESLERWHQLSDEQRTEVREPAAWLTKVVSRICLDQLTSARVPREPGRRIRLPEPRIGINDLLGERSAVDPAAAVTLAESISFAFLDALEKLTPAERVTFVLHELVGVEFTEIAETVGRLPAAGRRGPQEPSGRAPLRRPERGPRQGRRSLPGRLPRRGAVPAGCSA